MTHRRVAVDQERGYGVRLDRDLVPAAVEAVLGEVGGANGRAEPRVPVGPADGLQPLGQQGQVVERKPGRGRQIGAVILIQKVYIIHPLGSQTGGPLLFNRFESTTG